MTEVGDQSETRSPTAMQRRWRGGMVLVAALVVRVVLLATLPSPPITGDALDYERLASSMLDGHGYSDEKGQPTSFRSPGYALLLAGTYGVVGHHPVAVRVVQAVLDSFTCLFAFAIARRWFGDRVGLVCAALCVFSFGQLGAIRVILSETLATFLVTFSTWLLVRGIGETRRRFVASSGVVLGLALLTKGTFVFVPFFAGWALWEAYQRRWRPALARLALMMAFFLLVQLPWIARNGAVHHSFVPISTEGGVVLYSSVHLPDGRTMGLLANDEFVRSLNGLPEPVQNRIFMREALRYMVTHPGPMVRLVVLRFANAISPFDWELLGSGRDHGLVNSTFLFAAPFALLALVRMRKQRWPEPVEANSVDPRWPWALIVGLLGANLAQQLLTFGGARFRLPVEPILFVAAAWGIVHLIDTSRRRRFVVVATGGYLVTALALFPLSDVARVAVRDLLHAARLW